MTSTDLGSGHLPQCGSSSEKLSSTMGSNLRGDLQSFARLCSTCTLFELTQIRPAVLDHFPDFKDGSYGIFAHAESYGTLVRSAKSACDLCRLIQIFYTEAHLPIEPRRHDG
jgi:hypothetical protein